MLFCALQIINCYYYYIFTHFYGTKTTLLHCKIVILAKLLLCKMSFSTANIMRGPQTLQNINQFIGGYNLLWTRRTYLRHKGEKTPFCKKVILLKWNFLYRTHWSLVFCPFGVGGFQNFIATFGCFLILWCFFHLFRFRVIRLSLWFLFPVFLIIVFSWCALIALPHPLVTLFARVGTMRPFCGVACLFQ